MGHVREGHRTLLKSQKAAASFARISCSLPYVHFPENVTGSQDRDTLELLLILLFKSLERK